jgi:predicted ATPase
LGEVDGFVGLTKLRLRRVWGYKNKKGKFMAELVHFKNFAKLKDTKVEFNDITVLAGKPSTGKSYIMKYFYAIKESLYQEYSDYLMKKLRIEEIIKKMLKVAKSTLEDEETKKNLKRILSHEEYNSLYDEVKRSIDNKNISLKSEYNFGIYLDNIIKSIFKTHKEISDNYIIKTSQINIKFINNQYEVYHTKVDSIEETIFVETPLILEFKSFMNREKGKTPYHIESLLNILDTNYSFTNMEQEEFIRSFRRKSEAIIEGDIENSGNSFIFNRKDNKSYDILNTSSGVKSIGLLQYLVTNKALKKGSILFWEEPEVHLHPSWQLKMVDLFVELMNAGVKIVFSTHSPYMADYLNAISKKNGYRDRVSFNVLDEKDEVVSNHILDDTNWDILQKELMDTFEDILWQYL